MKHRANESIWEYEGGVRMDKSTCELLEADILQIVREHYENQKRLFEKQLKVDEVTQYLKEGAEMKVKSLEDYLSNSDYWLLAGFRGGEQGREDFSQFMNLVREQLKEEETN